MTDVHLVTGGNGFIGSHLVNELHRRHHDVWVLDKMLPSQFGKASRYIQKDISNAILDFTGVHTVYHLAALSNIIPSITDPRSYYETNVTGTFNVLEAARLAGVKKFVFAASASCYGDLPIPYGSTERDVINPQYPYALTKYLGEQLVLHYGKVYGMDVVSLRIFNCYGPGSLTKNAYGAMFNTFLAQKANGKPLTILGDGTQSRDFVYVTDVVEAFILAAEKGEGIYNVGTRVATSVGTVAGIIGGPTVNIPDRGGEPDCIYANNERLRGLGWEPKVSVEQGIAMMMENLKYWKNAKVWEPCAIEEQHKEWTACLGKD